MTATDKLPSQNQSAPATADTQALAEAFCAWPLPPSVCSDPCASMTPAQGYMYPRFGTNLLTVAEAKAMFDHLVERGLLQAAPSLAASSCEGVAPPEIYHPTYAHKADLAGPFKFPPPRWEATRADHEPARDHLMRCTHCGSVHPRDLLKAIKAGAVLRVADMKYGWPHKFYVSGVPNELAGQRAVVGSISGPTTDRSGKLCRDDFTPEEIAKGHYDRNTYGAAPPYAVVKFYSEHLADAEMQIRGGEYDTLQKFMAEASGYTFEVWEDHNVRCWRGR